MILCKLLSHFLPQCCCLQNGDGCLHLLYGIVVGIGPHMAEVPDTCQAANKWDLLLCCRTTAFAFSSAYMQTAFNVYLIELKRHKTISLMLGSLTSISLLFILILVWKDIVTIFTYSLSCSQLSINRDRLCKSYSAT